MRYDIYLSYTGYSCYNSCPRKYEFKYVKKEPYERDPKNALFGLIIGKLFEIFYEKRIWSLPDPSSRLLDMSEDVINSVFKKEKWDEHRDPDFCSKIRNDLRKYIPLAINTIKKHELLTPYSRAETDLTVTYFSQKYDMTVKIGGRSDFIHSKDRKNVWILDGKASNHKEKYIDPNQVVWYATQHYIKYNVAPTRLGFLFYKFPDDPIKWVSYDEDSVRSLLESIFDVSNKIRLKLFDPKPSNECKFCDYKNKCESGLKFLSMKRIEEGSRISESIFLLEEI